MGESSEQGQAAVDATRVVESCIQRAVTARKVAMVERCFVFVVLLSSIALVAQQPTVSQPATNGGSGAASATQANQNAASDPAKDAGTRTGVSRDSGMIDPLAPPVMPKGDVSLIGGTVTKIDKVGNKMTVSPFGGGKRVRVFFDERTHIYRNGVETTWLGIRKGDRVYVDTMLDGSQGVLARNIRVDNQPGPADARGQVISYDTNRGIMEIRDDLSAEPVRFNLAKGSRIQRSGAPATVADLQPGALVTVHFSPSGANRGTAQQVTVLAVPGDRYVFDGQVTNLDLRRGIISVQNSADQKTYDIHLGSEIKLADNLTVGSHVNVQAVFAPEGYRAQSITAEPGNQEAATRK